MAEVLGLAAGIIATIQLADRIASVCKLFTESLEDCPKDLRMIFIETSSTKALFDSLHFLRRSDPQAASFLTRLDGADGPVAGCYATITELEKLLLSDYLLLSQMTDTTRRSVRIAAVLAWPFKQKRARELLSHLVQYKTAINIILSGEIIRLNGGTGLEKPG